MPVAVRLSKRPVWADYPVLRSHPAMTVPLHARRGVTATPSLSHFHRSQNHTARVAELVADSAKDNPNSRRRDQ